MNSEAQILALLLLETIQMFNDTVQKARTEGRELTDDEVDAVRNKTRDAIDNLLSS